jgi:MoaA/NifB/PqqE/SkfB family radical SAM enzyme
MKILFKMENLMSKQELLDFEKEILDLFESTDITTPIHLSGGNEDESINIFKDIKEEDWVFSNHRSHYHALLKGISKEKLKNMILDGKSMHIFDKEKKFFSSSIVAGCPAIAAGVALGIKKKGLNQHVWCFIGDGAEEEGHFYEAVRYVDGWDLPCTFIIENNNRSVATPKSDRYNKSELAWPKCVIQYDYDALYPHYSGGNFVDFSKCEIKIPEPYKKELSTPIPSQNSTCLTYQEAIKQSMEEIAKDPKAIFLGYNVKYGNKGYGTLGNISTEQILETPLAENLMGGLAMGLSLEGFKPVLFFERHDFILNALDNIVNHIDKIEKMSYGEFKAPVLIRATVGSKYPLYPGPQHTQDFTKAFEELVCMPVYKPLNSREMLETYNRLKNFNSPAIIIEEKDKYSECEKMESQEKNTEELDEKDLPNQTDEEKKHGLVLDGHKISWHRDRINAWLKGERVAPITVDCALTRKCNLNCIYCYGQLQSNDEKKMTKEVIFNFLDDAAEIGVKGVSFMSDGESMCSPHVYDAIVHGKSKGLDLGFATNGAILKKDRLSDILPCLTWLRFNISAGEAKRYAEIHGCPEIVFHNVVERIKECVRIKKENNLQVTIGLQMVLLPDFKDQIVPLAKIGKDLGVDYFVIKHCSDDEFNTLGVEYEKYFQEDLINEIKKAEAMSDENYLVKAKWSKILSSGKRKYSKCFGPPFMIQLSGSGLVAPCGMLFNERYKDKFHIGNIAETRFKDIWKSDRYWEVMDRIVSPEFDARVDCGCLCLQHKVNEFLWDLKQEGVNEVPEPQGEKPQHINFI